MNGKQKRFCEEYVASLNVTEAAKIAGYSEKTAGQKGHEMLIKFGEHIAELMQERAKRLERDGDEVVRSLWAIHDLNIFDLIHFDGISTTMKPMEEIPPELLKYVKRVKETSKITDDGKAIYRELNIELMDKDKVIHLLGKHYGCFDERLRLDVVEHKRPEDMSSLTEDQLNDALEQHFN